MKTLIQKDIGTLVFIATLFTITKIGKQRKCPSIDDWIKKCFLYTHTYIHTYIHMYTCTHKHNGIIFSH